MLFLFDNIMKGKRIRNVQSFLLKNRVVSSIEHGNDYERNTLKGMCIFTTPPYVSHKYLWKLHALGLKSWGKFPGVNGVKVKCNWINQCQRHLMIIIKEVQPCSQDELGGPATVERFRVQHLQRKRQHEISTARVGSSVILNVILEAESSLSPVLHRRTIEDKYVKGSAVW